MTDTRFSFFNSYEVLKTFTNLEILTTFLLMFVITVVLIRKIRKKKYKLPPGPSGFPNLGQEPYKVLNKLKEIYGNVFSLYIGRTYTVILGDFEALKEAYSQTTEKSVGFDILPDALGFSGQNGEEWLEQRKFCVKSMRNYGIGKEGWESKVQMEVEDLVKLVSSFKSQPIDISKLLISSVSNNISSFFFGKQLPSDHPDRKFLDSIMEEIIRLLGQTPSNSLFPTSQDICLKLGIGEVYKRLKKFNTFFRRETELLKKSYKNGEDGNFILDYMKEIENRSDKSGHFFNETNLYGNIQGLFLGGSETTRTAIYWLLLIMANFPEVQFKVHRELDSVLGENGQIWWSDRNKVPFTFATIMEGQRWRTLTPLNSPRVPTKDIKLQNYDIPKGTIIIANIWGIHHDPKYWKEPEKFDPERFLTQNGKEIITKPDSYIPFSYGRRNCPGETIALMELLLYFTALMQNFTVLPPEGMPLNLDGIQGITYQACPQKLQFIPRKEKKVAIAIAISNLQNTQSKKEEECEIECDVMTVPLTKAGERVKKEKTKTKRRKIPMMA